MNYIQHTQLAGEIVSKGDLALNEDGALGIITSVKSGVSIGFHVSNDVAPKGSQWESKNPLVIGCVDDAKAFAESLKDE